ncbi:MAG: methyltransferase, partial [Bacteroidia bacterium]|nr:methyltransferase [Bacteroidia bacterium]
ARLYRQNYSYVGDYYEGAACVRNFDGLFTHIDSKGEFVHGQYYRELGVFHKGFAVAADDAGRFHIDKRGRPAYPERYLFIEPFYNGAAFAITLNGKHVVVGENGKILRRLDL